MWTAILSVYLSGTLAATVERSSSNKIRLVYDNDYLQACQPSLSVSIPKQEQPHDDTRGKIHNWLISYLPESPRILELYATTARVNVHDTIGLLASPLGADCIGAVQFCAPDNANSILLRQSSLERLNEREMVEELGVVLSGNTNLQESALYCSLPGYQRKVALRRIDDNWYKPLGAAPSTHILKPRYQSAKIVPVTEHLMLSSARRMGMDVSLSWLEQCDNMTVLVTERYDRHQSDGEWQRVHQEDLCQALGLPPTAKIEQTGGPTIQRIAEMLSVVSCDPSESISRFASGLLFAWLTINIDAHARNYGILHQCTRPRFAPLYDLNTSLPFDVEPISDLHLAMSYGGVSRIGELDETPPFAELGKQLSMNPDRLVEMAHQLGSSFPDALGDSIAELDKTYRRGLRKHFKNLSSNAEARAKLFVSF